MGEDVTSIITSVAQNKQQSLSSSIYYTPFSFVGKEYSVSRFQV